MNNNDEILEKIKNKYQKEEYELIYKAYLFNKNTFGEIMINPIENHLTHALKVTEILLDLDQDYITIAASLLHEVLNYSDITLDEITNEFGEEISKIIESFSAINNLSLESNNEDSIIYLRKVLVGLASDVRVIFIKLADRYHNMLDIWHLTKIDRTNKINETEQVLIPIAHRLGINSIKSKLEDLCLLYKDPEEYQDIENHLNASREELNELLMEMEASISDLLNGYGLEHEIKGRVKSIHSIYDKLHKKGKKWDDIYDVLALRIFVNNVTDCYTAIGLIHSKYRPLPKRFKDYIANPKENMYQSLHTTVFGSQGKFFEIQIRTYEMDEIAEKGIASHWSYKENGTIKAQNYMEQKLEVFRNLIENNLKNDSEDEVINEILNENIYVFTPKGDVVELPNNSTPIDFAYHIHSRVGDTMVGAIVNDEIVPLNYQLNNNDIVEIKTNPNSTPSKDWLNIVVSSQARNKIKAYFNQKDKEEYILRGKNLLEKEIKKNRLVSSEVLSNNNLEKILKTLKLNEIDDLYLNIGSLRYTPAYVISIVDENKQDVYDILLNKISNYHNRHQLNSPVNVEGIDNIRISFAKCCSPIYGDDIVGLVTVNQGITIHCKNCKNLIGKENIVNVNWNNVNNDFIVTLIIKTLPDKNYLIDLVSILANLNTNISKVDTNTSEEENIYKLDVKVKNIDELNHIITTLNNRPFINSIKRGN